MSNTVRIVAHIPARPDKVDEVRAALSALLAPTRAEAGCLSYELLQNRQDPTDFTFVEEWESDAAIDSHMASAHLQAALALMPEMLAGAPQIHRYTLIG